MASTQDRTQDRGAVLDIIERQAERSSIPREDFLRFAYIETGGRFNPDAHNTDSGAKGLFQFVPGTAREFGLTGREFDAAANTEAAAALYARNRTQIVNRQAETGHPFLSGADQPNGLDMYLAHQQGGGGYASIQRAIATGEFSRDDTRQNILGNVSARDFERVTGQPFTAIQSMNDRDLATSFAGYWTAKYAAIEIPDRGITASATQSGARAAAAALADGVLQQGERGDDVRALQASLNQLGFRDAQGNALETDSGIYGQRTLEAVRGFQQANGLDASGRADAATRDAVLAQQALPEAARTAPAQPAAHGAGGTAWPTPGNDRINAADQPGEGRGEFGTRRSGGRTHGGIDLQGDVGDPIVAFAGGRVTVAPNNGAAGNTVRIQHDDGSMTKYFHLEGFSVRNGERVEAGQQIGTMGRTGNTPARGDTHLHFELWRDGRKVDPLPELRDAARTQDGQSAQRAGTPQATPGQLLKEGSRGQGVADLQQQLNTLGVRDANGQPLARDGIYGEATRSAVLELQRAQGLRADGIVGPETLGRLGELARATSVGKVASAAAGPGEGRAQDASQDRTQTGFLEKMFAAVNTGDAASIQKVLKEQVSSLTGQWQASPQDARTDARAGAEQGKPPSDPQR